MKQTKIVYRNTYNSTQSKIGVKVVFFRKYDALFSLPKKCAENYHEKEILKLCSVQSQLTLSNCTAGSKGGKIQNTKFRVEQSTFFGQSK